MNDTNAVLHLATDDSTYYSDFTNMYKDAIAKGRLDFGTSAEALKHLADVQRGEWYGHVTTVRSALIDFKVLSNCIEFHGTTGSTVTFVVRWLNEKYGNRFAETSSIGNWTVPLPTKAFRSDCVKILPLAVGHLMDPSTYNISNQQANVLDFLAEYHMEEI